MRAIENRFTVALAALVITCRMTAAGSKYPAAGSGGRGAARRNNVVVSSPQNEMT